MPKDDTPTTADDLLEYVRKKLALRPDKDGESVEFANGVLLNEEQRTAMARYRMLKAAGHRCFCTSADVPGRGKACCITGVTLPMSDRATFEADGGDVGSGTFGEGDP